MNKLIVSTVIVAVVFGAAGFFGGVMYQKSQPTRFGANFGRNADTFESQAANATRRSGGLQGGFTSGDVVSKDSDNITLKLNNGSTRIVFYSGSTQISKQVSGTIDDVAVGSTVMVTGTPNSDGSVSAQSISLRSSGPVPGQPGGAPSGANAPGQNPQNGNLPAETSPQQ